MATRMADGSFSVDSMTSDCSYRVTLKPVGCSCPHFTRRLAGTGQECKHILHLRSELAQQTALGRCAEKAADLTDADLQRYAREKAGTAAGCACLLELAVRRANAAPREILAGVLALLEGATEAERERALSIYR